MNEIRFNEKYISDELLNSIVREVISEGKSKKSPHHPFYETVLNLVETPGFRPGQEPPPALFATNVKKVSKKNNIIFLGLMLAWRDIHANLKDIVAKYFEDNPIHKEICNEDNIDDYISEIVQNIKLPKDIDYGKREISLMIYLEINLRSEENIEDETDSKEEDSNSEEVLSENDLSKHGKWEKVINDVNKWSAYDQEWDSVNDFIESLLKIADQKKEEKNETVEPAKELLNALKVREEDILYFNLSNIKYWDVEKVKFEKIIDLKEKLSGLDEKIAESSKWRKKEEKTTDDRRKKNEMLDKIENSINELYSDLDEKFFSDDLVNNVEKSSDPVDGLEKKLSECDQTTIQKDDYTELDNSVSEQGKDDMQNTAETETDENSDTEIIIEIADRGEVEEKDKDSSELAIETDYSEGDINTIEKEENTSTTEVLDKLDDTEGEEVNIIWDLIRNGDLPSAYCLADAVSESENIKAPVPKWLIASVQGAHWMMITGQKYVSDLSKISSIHDPSKEGVPSQLMGLSAALIVNLVAPSIGMMHWLDIPNNYNVINKLVDSVREFSDLVSKAVFLPS